MVSSIDTRQPRPRKRLYSKLALIGCLMLLAIAIAGSSETFAQDDGDQNLDVVNEPVAVEGLAGDEAIEKRLQGAFESSGWFENLTVKSDNGIVTLTGTADTEEHREWAIAVVRRTQDVLAVIDKLDVAATVDVSSSANSVRKSLLKLWNDFLSRSPLLLASVLALIITALLARLGNWLTHRVLENRNLRISLKDLIGQLLSISIWVIGLLTASILAFPGMTPSKALTVLGLGSVAIGFAFKDIFENFFAGVLILWQYPFDRGDFIACGDVAGKVEQITIRSTLIRQIDGELTVLPNAVIFKNRVDVLTSQPQRRVRIICGVAYGEDVDASREVILKAVQECKSVQGVRMVEVLAKEFADSSINFEVVWWTGAKPADILRSRDEVISAIKRALDEAGIEIPFPYRTLTFKDPGVADALRLESPPSDP